MGVKANHHYVPQFYLRGFSDGVGRKARLFAVDLDEKKSFKPSVRNVGSKRNFNRVELEGVDPNQLEDELAEHETIFASHLADVIEKRSFPTSAHFNSILNPMHFCL